jgi:hypothetical protein
MRSVSLWRTFINISIKILDIVHGSVVYLKLGGSGTEFRLRFQVESTEISPIDRDSIFKISDFQDSDYKGCRLLGYMTRVRT